MNKLYQILHVFRFVLGGLLLIIGGLGVLFGVLAIADPVGTQLSNDNDPFGVPPTALENLFLILFYCFISLTGVSLIAGFTRLKNIFLGAPTSP